MKTQKIDRIFGTIAILSIILAGFIGARLSGGDVASSLIESFPEADRFEPQNGGSAYQAVQSATNEVLGYVAIATANGYGGPMKVAVAVDLDGNIHGLSIISTKETSSWMQKVMETDFIHSLLGKSFLDSFQIGLDVDGVTGATYTSRAIAEAALSGSQFVAEKYLGLSVPNAEVPKVEFGLKEITLMVLFAIGYFGHQGNFKYKKQARWASMLIGMVVLGFLYTRPLTLSDVNKVLLGLLADLANKSLLVSSDWRDAFCFYCR